MEISRLAMAGMMLGAWSAPLPRDRGKLSSVPFRTARHLTKKGPGRSIGRHARCAGRDRDGTLKAGYFVRAGKVRNRKKLCGRC